jgi:hypothetical protein
VVDVRRRLSLLMIEDIVIGGCDVEISSPIAMRFKKESPIGRSMFVSMANGGGNSGYIPDCASFGQQTFEVLSSRCQPGYAESANVKGHSDLIADSKRTKSRRVIGRILPRERPGWRSPVEGHLQHGWRGCSWQKRKCAL